MATTDETAQVTDFDAERAAAEQVQTSPQPLENDVDEIVVPRTALQPTEMPENTPRRAQHVRRRINIIRQQVDDAYVEMGQLLREVRQYRYWGLYGFDSFESFAETELRMRRRKAYYLMSVVDAYERLAIGPGEREGISLSNAVEIAAATRENGQPIDITPERREELLHLAQTQTTRELRQTLREERGLPPVEFAACNFAVTVDQQLIIDQALETVRIAAGANEDELSRGRLLELMAAEYLAGAAGYVVQRNPEGDQGVIMAPTLETAQARAREALHDLSAMDPDGYVLESVIKDVVGIPDMGVCPNCGVPVGITELDEEDIDPVKTETKVGDLFGAAA